MSQIPSAFLRESQGQTRDDIMNAYSKGEDLFHEYQYHGAIKIYKGLLRRRQDIVSDTLLWFNIGILHDHLGEHALAA